jgi:hypothetical protein
MFIETNDIFIMIEKGEHKLPEHTLSRGQQSTKSFK